MPQAGRGRDEALHAEERALLVLRLRDPVGVEDDRVSPSEAQPVHGEIRRLDEPEHAPALDRDEPRGPVRGHEHRRLVAGHGQGELPAREVQDPGDRGDEHPGVVVAAEAPVHRREERRRVGLARGHGLEHRLGPRHEERRPNPLAGDVADQEEHARAIEEVVEEVAAHRARGHEGRAELEAFPVPSRHGLGQHVRLDALCDLDLPLESFFGRGRLLQVADVVLQRVAHVVEGAGQRPHFVA